MRRKSNLLAAVGVPLLTLLLTIAASLPLAAQQLPNSSFDTWKDCVPWTSTNNTDSKGSTPRYWTISHVAGQTEVGKCILEETDADNTTKSNVVFLQNKSLLGNIIPGYITLGTTWSTSEVKWLQPVNKDGGTFGGLEFKYRPDALKFWYKRGSTDKNGLGNIIVYGWKGTWTQQNVPGNIVMSGSATKVPEMHDRDRNILNEKYTVGGAVSKSEDADLIFSATDNIGNSDKWIENTVHFNYLKADVSPEKINIIISCNTSYWESNNSKLSSGQDLYIDDVRLVYYSHLENVKVGGTATEEIKFEVVKDEKGKPTNQFVGYYDGYINNLSASDITYTLPGNSNSVELSEPIIAKNNNDYTVTIKVRNKNLDYLGPNPTEDEKKLVADEDGFYEHIYTIHCDFPKLTQVNIPSDEPYLPNGGVIEFKNGSKTAEFGYYIGRINIDNLVVTENNNPFVLDKAGHQPSVSVNKTNGVLTFTVTDDGVSETYTVTGPHCSTLASVSLDIIGQEENVVIPLFNASATAESEKRIMTADYDGYIDEIGIGEESSHGIFIVKCTEIKDHITKDEENNKLIIEVKPNEDVDPTTVQDTDGLSSHTYTINCWIPASEITFKQSQQVMVLGQTLTLTVEDLTFGSDNARPDFEFSTTAKEGVEISEDKQTVTVTPTGAGTITITATSRHDSDLTATATITVNALPTEINVNEEDIPDYIYLDNAHAFNVEVGYEPAGAPTTGITLTSSDNDLLTVTENEDGTWTVALKDGAPVEDPETVTLTATVKYKDADNKEASLPWTKEIVVENRPIVRWYDSKGKLLQSPKIGMVPGDTKALSAATRYLDGVSHEIEYIISDNNVIDFADGVLTAISEGTSTLTARVKDFTDKEEKAVERVITVTVSEKVSYPATIVGPENLPTVIYLGANETLKSFSLAPKYIASDNEEATVHPDEAWTVSDNAIASVDEHGKVSIKTPAKFDPVKQKTLTVTLTASYTDGNGAEPTTLDPKIWTFDVVQPATGITWQQDNKTVTAITLKEDQEVKLAAVVAPASATDKTLSYTIDAPDVIKYENGVLTPIGTGTATLTAKSKEWDEAHPGVSKSITVTVEPYVVPTAMKVVNSAAIPTHIYLGETKEFAINVDFEPSVAGKELDGDVTKSWTCEPAGIVKVSSNGKVTFANDVKKVEDVTVTLTATHPRVAEPFSASWDFTVRRPVASLNWLDEAGASVADKGLTFKENQIPVLRSQITPAAPTDTVVYSVIAEDGKEPIIDYKEGKLIVTGCGTNILVARAKNFPDDPGKRQAKEKQIIITVEPLVIPTEITATNESSLSKPLYIGETPAFTISKAYVPSVEGKKIDLNDIDLKEVWSSSNPEVLKVSQAGRVSFADNIEKPENAVITLTTTFKNAKGEPMSIEKSWTFTVRQPVTDVEWRDENGKAVKSLSLADNATMSLAAVVKPESATDKELTFEIRAGKEKAPVIEYSDGVVRALGRGTAELVAISDNFSADGRDKIEFKLPVTVSAMTRSIAITEAGGNEEFFVGKRYKFEADITPAYEGAVELTWTSSDPEVASIAADGTMTALATGSTTITVSDPDGNKATYEVAVQPFPTVTTEIPGYLTVSALDGTSTTIATSLELTTTSWTTLDLTLTDATVNGFPLGAVKMDGVEYSADTDGNGFMQLHTSREDTRLELDGGVTVAVGISAGTESFVDLVDEPAIAEVHFDLSLVNAGMNMQAVFSTTMPAGFVDPGKPEAGTTVDYDGTILVNVTTTRSRAQTETFEVNAVLKVTYLTEPDADGWFTADIEVPALHFGAIDEESLAPGEEPDYRYNLASFVMDRVTALRKGNVITYRFEETEVATEADGYYLASISGKTRDNGSAAFELGINDNNGTIINGSFSNEGPEGELYKGYLSIDMAGAELADNMPASVIIIPSEDGETATFILPNLTLDVLGMSLGDIRVDNVTVTTDANGTKTYEGYVEKMQLLDGQIEAEVKMSGTIDAEGYADMTINVVWMDTPINVRFTGEMSGTTSGIESPANDADAAIIDGPVEYFTIGGIRVADGQRLAPGIYIERRGNQARKILVR